MDVTGPVLPPSPPLSNPSCINSCSASNQSPVLTPPKTPDMPKQILMAAATKTTTIGESPLPPLPSEVVRLILSHIPSRERGPLLLVSRRWRRFVVGNTAPIPTAAIFLHEEANEPLDSLLERVSVNGDKARVGVRDVAIVLRAATEVWRKGTDLVDEPTALDRLEYALAQVDSASVFNGAYDQQVRDLPRSTVRNLSITLHPDSKVSLTILRHLAAVSRYPLFRNLARLTIYLCPPGLQVDGHFFGIWPDLNSLVVAASPEPTENYSEMSELWSIRPTSRDTPQVCHRLQNLEWHNLYISAKLCHVFMPNLTRLNLTKCTWEGKGLFLMLRLVRKTLVYLECRDLVIDELDDVNDMEADWHSTVLNSHAALLDGHVYENRPGRYEDPSPINFSALRTLILVGESTPPIFSTLEYNDFSGADEPSGYATPTFLMPVLETVVFEELVTDQEVLEEDEGDGTLVVFGRNAPRVVSLELYKLAASEASIYYSLAGMEGQIRYLSLQGSEASDKLIAKLPLLLPRLEVLDVRECSIVTIQGVARLVEVVREAINVKIRQVRVDPPTFAGAEYAAWLWLDFIGVLVRDENDPEGLGPKDPESRRRWIREGKKDAFKMERERRERELVNLAKAQAAHDADLAARYGFRPSGGGGSSARMTTMINPPQQQQQQQMLPPLPSLADVKVRLPIFAPTPLKLQEQTPPSTPAIVSNAPLRSASAPPPSFVPSVTTNARSVVIDPRLAFVGTLRAKRTLPDEDYDIVVNKK